MKRRDLESAVASATGEDVHEIRRRGFSLLNLRDRDFDPEPDNLQPRRSTGTGSISCVTARCSSRCSGHSNRRCKWETTEVTEVRREEGLS